MTASNSITQEQKAASFSKEVTLTLSLKYLVALPKGYEDDPKKKWPLMVFLHGAGERGDNLEDVKAWGPPKQVAEGKEFPCIVISPQCPEGSWWIEQPVMELIEHVEEIYRVDSDRIVMTGLSMGGFGTWHFASFNPQRFSAIAPICGGGNPYFMKYLKHLPIWTFHGTDDTVIPVGETDKLVEALRELSHEQLRYDRYKGVNHNSWARAYATPELYPWLLEKRR